MRDSVGGTFMIYVLLIFLAVYIVFVAVAFNYARAFRVKNKVIDIIEQNEGIQEMESSSNLQGITSGVFGQINSYLQSASYRVNDIGKSNCEGYDYINTDRGYCIAKIDQDSSIDGIESSYYKVRTFVYIEFPFMKLKFTIPVNGETRRIERINN
jgi:hypothetical protein